MPDLETQIQSWRRGMRASGIKPSGTLDELEDHLRGDIERRMRLGARAQRAFEMAAESIGQPRTLRGEFQKVQSTLFMNLTPTTRRRLHELLVVIALVAIQAALLLPIVEKAKAHQALATFDIAALVVLGTMYLSFTVYFVRKRSLKA